MRSNHNMLLNKQRHCFHNTSLLAHLQPIVQIMDTLLKVKNGRIKRGTRQSPFPRLPTNGICQLAAWRAPFLSGHNDVTSIRAKRDVTV